MKEYVKLSEVCNIIMGQSPESNSYNELGNGLPFFQGNADFGELYPVTKMWCTEPKKIVEKNTLLISVRAPIGALNFSTERCCIGRGLAGITAKAPTDLKYIYYGLMNKKEELNRLGTGSTFKAINKKVLENTLIVKEKAERQHNIVKVLDKNILIIAHLQKQLYLLDELVKSRFVELFGTYPANEKRWATGKVRDVILEAKYGSSRPAVDGGKYPYLRMNNITYDGELDLSDIKFINIPDKELPKCTVKRGDVLFNRTNSKELVGKTCVYNRDEMMVLAGFVIRIRVNDKVLPEFLSAFLNTDFSKQMLASMCKNAIGQANINSQEMQNIGIYIPPIERQRMFVFMKNEIDKSRLLFKCQLLQYHNIEHIIRGRNYG